ncbi:hypothetical protein WI36_05075 [Burkholderia ubonensis]|uniref:Uncharacterized protein n=1 Tax=Burkholderia ubonensis TaxID=101571 RepID=A0A124KLT5_9BURK|nr:hypothetical protein [Burkholderia ubonensis]AOI74629.1 hypothetical protein WI31_27340 [Burkholderia ubonensis]KUZ12669.1 hypothetical protein WI29_27800 [Burkholderia ubonensis]KUZ33861.1 hypothetical protein WI30_14305 [Burkholderia ubonensis]KUZ41444.1 hypothetical protein WI32_05470 [Burkholderia ubonensis]KUZ48695.1 hypothetical protein WI33_21060 [Burkholderia ubonensis]
MACNDEDERELRHVAAMIDELSRVDVSDRQVATTSVMDPAYWRARLDAIRSRVRAGSRAATLAQMLGDRLDELERRQWRDGASGKRKR